MTAYTNVTAEDYVMAEPWSGCIACGHPAHPFNGNRDVRCNAPTNLHGHPGNGPEPCGCVQWEDVLAAYADIEAKATDALSEWFARVEAARPEGDYRTVVLIGSRCSDAGCGRDYSARLEGPNGEITASFLTSAVATPTDALRALADAIAKSVGNV